ncbi:MAG: hypothetical protein PWR03_1121 [Tenuifilum sp.]|uniref:glycosyltransferase n=1 Tax=Tenuifilum sp. TaxID=2760880 RepID=UPI0024AC4138|nr:glycosyltransferase [Tenuifilum sp.]MDI3526938.1 hypothetical protein [Tenuifilum sp.]
MQIVSLILFLLYAIAILILLGGLLSSKWVRKNNVYRTENRKVSVIVAFRNERGCLTELIKSLAGQDLQYNHWEAILVDDHSSDGSYELALSLAQGLPVSLYKLPKELKGKKSALLFGLSKAQHDIVAITDADCVLPSSWLREISFEMAHTDFFQGEVRPIVGARSLISWFEALDYTSLMAVSAASFALHRPVIAASANLAFNRKLIPVDSESIRLDVHSGDDMFLLHAAKKQKIRRMRFLSSTNIAVQTYFDGGLNGFLNRRIRWASKAKSYTDIETIILASIVFAINAWLVMLLVLGALGFFDIMFPLKIWFWKSALDFIFLFTYLIRTNQLKLLVVFLPLQVVYPFYITLAALTGLIKGITWKGRTSV